MPRAAASELWRNAIAVCLSTSERFPKVEFMLSSFLDDTTSSGYFRSKSGFPNRDSIGGRYSRLGEPRLTLPVAVGNWPEANGRKGSGIFSRIDCSFSSRSSVIPARKGWPEPSVCRIMSSSVSSKHGSVNPIAFASSRKTSTFGFVSPGAGSAGRAICR
jgi:hypothetical protein